MTDEMPANFNLRYVFWVVCRWLYFNPLTILFIIQGWLVELAVGYPDIKWISHAASAVGIVVAQIRNRNKDYSVPIKSVPKDDSSTQLPETP